MLCAQCGSQLKEGVRFCTSCGEAVTDTPATTRLGDRRGSESRMSTYPKIRRYSCDEPAFLRLLPALSSWLESQAFDCQQMTTPEGGTLVQISKRGGWRKLAGMSTALNILLTRDNSRLIVEIGAGRWGDKVVAGTVSLFVRWPFLVTAAWGAWDQLRMPEKVFGFIEQQVRGQT